MHELSIASALLKQVLETAARNRLVCVEEVVIEVGAMQLVVPEALETAFTILSEDTPAEGAVLKQVEEPIQGRCRSCGRTYRPDIDRYQCPGCGRADCEIVGGRDIILQSLSGPVEEEIDP